MTPERYRTNPPADPSSASPPSAAQPSTDRQAPLSARALWGSLWTTGGYGVSQLVRLAGNLVLTRLLFPEAFGLMALVGAFLSGLAMFSDVGLAPSVVQSRRGDDPSFLGTAWTIQIVRGFVLWIASLLLAWPIASFYGEPLLAEILPIAGLAVLIAGFNSTSLLQLRRHLTLGRLTLLQLISQLAGTLAMLSWAWVSPSVWALVVGGLTMSLVLMALSHTAIGYRSAGPRWDRTAARDLFHFGKWIFLSTMLTFLAGQADRLILGSFVPLGLLGVYSIAAMFARLPVDVIQKVGATVLFPALSHRVGSPPALRAAYARARSPLLALSGFLIATAAGAGRPLIETLYDARYVEAGWILQLLALGAWFQVLLVPGRSALLALGTPGWLVIANGAKIVGLVAVPVGFWTNGLMGGVVGFVVADAVRYSVFALGARRHGLGTLSSDLVLSLLVLLAAAGGLATADAIERAGGSDPWRLVASVFAACAAWLPVAYVLARAEIQRLAGARLVRGRAS